MLMRVARKLQHYYYYHFVVVLVVINDAIVELAKELSVPVVKGSSLLLMMLS
jgi:hypothetical protein